MDKQIITFSANEQNLVRIGGEYHYSSNKVSYIGAHFDLGQNWDGFDSVRAVWFTDRINGISTVLDGEGNCTVPTEVLKKKDRVFVNLVGSIVSNGELTDRLTTYPAVALVVDSKAKVDSTETAPITPSQFEQFVSIVQDAVANIKDIVSTTLNADYTLTFVYSDGTSYTTPSIRGERGPQGADGADGTDGNGIASAVLNSNYTLTLTFTDGTSYTTPSIRGAQGPKGDTGDVSQAQLDAAVSDLKSNFSNFADGIQNLDATFVNGSLSSADGSINTGTTYRVSSSNLISFDSATKLTVANGFRFLLLFWSDADTYAHDGSGWVTANYTVPKNQLFKITIARVTEDGYEIADINTFVSKVTLATNIEKRLTALEEKTSDIVKYTEYDIYADGTGDFVSIRSCLDRITDSSETNRYIVNIHEGDYNVALQFTNDELANGYGMFVPDYVTLRGVGDRRNVIVAGRITNQSDKWCPINIRNNACIENLTLDSYNCRYTVHDDWQVRGDFDNNRIIRDCIIKGEKCYYGVTYGSGVKGGANWLFENCIFDGTKSNADGTSGAGFLCHNNVDVDVPNNITFDNCRFLATLYSSNKYRRGVCLGAMTNNADNGTLNVVFKGCEINGFSLYENNASEYGAGINIYVSGYGNKNADVLIVNTDGEDYSGNVDLI